MGEPNPLIGMAKGLAERWEDHQIVMLVDEIGGQFELSELGDQSLPESVRMILVLNPDAVDAEESPLTLPPSFLHVTLTTPYRSTIAITRLTHFIAKCRGLVVPDIDFGSDVEGVKPIIFDIGNDRKKIPEALEKFHKQPGDNTTVLFKGLVDDFNLEITSEIEKWMKAAGANWDCSNTTRSFTGSEAEKVLAVTNGDIELMEAITRAKTILYILLVADDEHYSETKDYFQQAAEEGLVEMN